MPRNLQHKTNPYWVLVNSSISSNLRRTTNCKYSIWVYSHRTQV